ncbi:MAG: GNAT family N-acetyltransferase [Erysipelotrichales bacterium]|nr:GNAT family N-acetyltransferase [Erysipelotrichales bacterium]
METINIGVFNIEEYDPTNIDHKSTLVSLSNDYDFMYIGDLFCIEEEFRIAKEKGEKDTLNIAFIADIPVGMIGFNILEGKFYLLYAVLPEFRGNHYAARIALEYAKYLFTQYPDIDSIYASINKENHASMKSIEKAGFKRTSANIYNTNYVLKRL